MGVLGIFLLVFGFVVYKAMTHDPEALAEKRFEEYTEELRRQEQKEQDNGQ